MRLQQGFATNGMGYGVKLNGNNLEPPMSRMGQSRTHCDARVSREAFDSGLVADTRMPPVPEADIEAGVGMIEYCAWEGAQVRGALQ